MLTVAAGGMPESPWHDSSISSGEFPFCVFVTPRPVVGGWFVMVSRTFKRRRDALAYATTTEADRLRGVGVDPRHAQVTLADYSNAWLDRRHDLAVRTAELYRWVLERHVLPTFGATSLGNITPSAVRSWHAKIAKGHPATASKAYRLLSTILRTAVADEVIGRNPCQVKGASQEKAPERPVASVSEVQALAAAMPDHLRLLVLLAAWCQLRRAELLGLRRRDLDLLRGTVSIVITRTTAMSGHTIEKAPKSDAGRRTVAIPPNISDDIAAHLDAFVSPDPNAWVFAVSDKTVQRAWIASRRGVGRIETTVGGVEGTFGEWVSVMDGIPPRD
jgi:integrase